MLRVPAARQQERLTRLFDFIKKSQLVNEVLPSIRADDPNLDLIQAAIQSGDYAAEVLRLQNADAYVLYLLKEGRASYDDGMTAYLYLLCYMQYHENGQLKPTDQAFHASREMSVRQMVEMGANQEQQLTKEGQEYVDGLLEFINGIRNKQLTEQEIKAFLFAAPPSQQQLIHIGRQKPNTALTPEANSGLSTIFEVCGFVKIFGDFDKLFINNEASVEQLEFYLPPTSLIDYIVLQISQKNPEEVVLPVFAFGIANTKTLARLHQTGWRIASLYSQYVKNNLLQGHFIAMGPIGMLFHDLTHSIGIQLVSNKKYLFISEKMVPLFWKFSEQEQNINTFNSEFGNLIADALNDHNYLSGYETDQSGYKLDERLDLEKHVYNSLSLAKEEKVRKRELLSLNFNCQDQEAFNYDVTKFAKAIADLVISDLSIDNAKQLGSFKSIWQGLKSFLSSGDYNLSNNDLLDEAWKKIERHFDALLSNKTQGYSPRFHRSPVAGPRKKLQPPSPSPKKQ